jgi:hypothetical protein
MRFKIALALLVVAGPVLAQRYSRPIYDQWEPRPLEGIYAGIAGGGQLMFLPGADGFGSENAAGYHLYARPRMMVYVRAGLGIGLSSDVTSDGSNAAGLAGAGGIGMEFRLSPGLFLAPEIFYKHMNLSGTDVDTDVQMLGIQLGLIYY